MARFNSSAGVLFVEGTDIVRNYFYTAVLINLDNIWDIKFLESYEKDGVFYYEMYVYYIKNEIERHLLITKDEYEKIQELIGGRRGWKNIL